MHYRWRLFIGCVVAVFICLGLLSRLAPSGAQPVPQSLSARSRVRR